MRLTALQLFARQVHVLLDENGGRMSLAAFESSFLDRSVLPSCYTS